jgi:rubredoxin
VRCGGETTTPHPHTSEKLLHSSIGGSMSAYECIACGYIYDPAEGDPFGNIPPGTPFEDLPEDWLCPDCGLGKEEFERID